MNILCMIGIHKPKPTEIGIHRSDGNPWCDVELRCQRCDKFLDYHARLPVSMGIYHLRRTPIRRKPNERT
jgi:hypothetical protein